MKLLGRSASINVRKVLWLLHELGIPYEHEEWGSAELNLSDPAFLRLNPNAQVPVLVDGELALWESNTICRYLAARAGRTDLLPPQPSHDRACVEQWMDWQATDLNWAWRYPFMALVRNHPDYADAESLRRSVQTWNRLMKLLDEHLASAGPYVTGGRFTLADIVLGLSLNRWLMTPIERPGLPHLEFYRAKLAEREGFGLYCANGVP